VIFLKPMSQTEFDAFKLCSQREFAAALAAAHSITLEQALASASEQFGRIVPNGIQTKDHLFFEAIDRASNDSIGYIWLDLRVLLGAKVASVNDIYVREIYRNKGLGKKLMTLLEVEAKAAGASRVRLHVFQSNKVAFSLYQGMGYQISSLDMMKEI
jgi:ribosomal protein S18 acetylase RimI-like enzyme